MHISLLCMRLTGAKKKWGIEKEKIEDIEPKKKAFFVSIARK
jgi:hypothetical protein